MAADGNAHSANITSTPPRMTPLGCLLAAVQAEDDAAAWPRPSITIDCSLSDYGHPCLRRG